MTTKAAMIGVGKLGQACAEVMAESYPLVGYDVSPREPKNFPMVDTCLLYTSPSPRDRTRSRMPSSA